MDRKTKEWVHLLQTVHTTSGALALSYSMDTRAPFPKVQGLKREASLGMLGTIPLIPPLPFCHENNLYSSPTVIWSIWGRSGVDYREIRTTDGKLRRVDTKKLITQI